MDRRGFLRLLGLGTAAAVIAPKLSVVDWANDKLQVVMPAAAFTSGQIPLSLEWMTEKIAWEMEQRLGSRFHSESSDMLGKGSMRHHFGVDLNHPSESDSLMAPKDFADRWLIPAAAQMAGEIEFNKITSFGKLTLPSGVERACNIWSKDSGICVRGISAWHPGDIWTPPRQLIRFDVLAG